MSDTKKIRDVCSRFSSGKAISAKKVHETGMYPVYGGNGLRGYTDDYNFEGDCAVIGRQGAYCGNVKYFSGTGYMTEHAVVAVANRDNDTRFLSYKFGLMDLGRYAGQSAQPGLSVETLLDVDIDVPSKDEQERIAKVLSTIDEKITINAALCTDLEAMAKLLYDYWFVQFDFSDENGKPYKSSGGKMVWNEELKREIPDGWEVKLFKDVLEIGNGKDHKTLSDGNIPVYGSGGLMRTVNMSLYEGESVLIPRKGTLNNIMYVNESFWTVDTMYYTKMKYKNIAKYMYYATKTYDFERLNTGTGVPSMTTDIIYKLKVLMPKEDITQRFDKALIPWYQLIKEKNDENQQLASLRDFLLPMLMNGQVTVTGKVGEEK